MDQKRHQHGDSPTLVLPPVAPTSRANVNHLHLPHVLGPGNGAGARSNTRERTNSSSNHESKVVVLGSPAVGKSALVVRFLTNRFIWEYDPTLECTYRHHTVVDDEEVCMDILDTAGLGDDCHQEGNIRWGDGFILVYSLTDRQSMEHVTRVYDHISSLRNGSNYAFVIVANKSDLQHMAQVSVEEAETHAAELGGALFVTSACDGGTAIGDAFHELHREIVRRRWVRRRRSSAKQVIEVINKMFTRINT